MGYIRGIYVTKIKNNFLKSIENYYNFLYNNIQGEGYESDISS